jgi:hypothetical protein
VFSVNLHLCTVVVADSGQCLVYRSIMKDLVGTLVITKAEMSLPCMRVEVALKEASAYLHITSHSSQSFMLHWWNMGFRLGQCCS